MAASHHNDKDSGGSVASHGLPDSRACMHPMVAKKYTRHKRYGDSSTGTTQEAYYLLDVRCLTESIIEK